MIKLPKGVKVCGISGKWWRGEIPVADCHPHHAEKYAPTKTDAKKTTVKAGK
jgi:hypothetical protein